MVGGGGGRGCCGGHRPPLWGGGGGGPAVDVVATGSHCAWGINFKILNVLRGGGLFSNKLEQYLAGHCNKFHESSTKHL